MSNKEKVVKFPMNSHEKFMKDKKCDYKTLAIMTLYSNHTPLEVQHDNANYEEYRYLYKNKVIQFTEEIEELSKTKINTILRNMKKLSNLSNELVNACKNENEQIYYVINYSNGERCNKYVTIEDEMLRYLVNTGNSNVIKVYILIKYLCQYELDKYNKKEKKITYNYLLENIGLSIESHNSRITIKNIIECLRDGDFINTRKAMVGCKTIIYYSINDYDEWKRRRIEKRDNDYKKKPIN